MSTPPKPVPPSSPREELIRELLKAVEDGPDAVTPDLLCEAAAALQALERERDEWKQRFDAVARVVSAARDDYNTEKARAEKAEATLAAVSQLGDLWLDDPTMSVSECADDLAKVLAP
jgi:hypothetical protein